jgi:alpha-N-arabinofuranosidase
MKITVNAARRLGTPSPMLYGHFLEHFHRQVYVGVFDPASPFADADGFRTDVLDALRRIRIPILRWPGGCFVSSYHWQKGVGQLRVPVFDKAWRVEESNRFGTDEFIRLCRKLNCAPYLCTNAGTGTLEEMSDWVEYCNLPAQGTFARMRIANGAREPHAVPYWSIGNENYGSWELGAKTAEEWGRLVLEAAKLMKHVDPSISLSAAALPDTDWNLNLLRAAGHQLDWLSIHAYWDPIHNTNALATYEQAMAYTAHLGDAITRVRGLLTALGLEKRIKIAFDEWNLRGWYHPNMHTETMGRNEAEYLTPRDLNDLNSSYTMADAVFTACFLSELNRHCDIVGMANFAPAVNTRGCIYTHAEGIVLRTTYHVFDLYVNHLLPHVVDAYAEDVPLATFTDPKGQAERVALVDVLATAGDADGPVALALTNKAEQTALDVRLCLTGRPAQRMRLRSLCADTSDSYNDVGREAATIRDTGWMPADAQPLVTLPPHSVHILTLE